MHIDPMMLLAAVLGIGCIAFVLLVCSSWSSGESACPARFWSRRPSWDHDKGQSERH